MFLQQASKPENDFRIDRGKPLMSRKWQSRGFEN